MEKNTVTLTLIIIVIVACILMLGLYMRYRTILYQNKLTALTELHLLKHIQQQQALTNELTELKEKISHDLLHDPLTDLPGKQIFEDRLLQTLNLSQRYQLVFGILFVDIDAFKVINEALGHDVGDELLKEIAIRLQSAIRQVDTLSRFAGDKFVIILTQLSKPEAAAYVAQRLLNVVSQPVKIHNQELFITASIGVATYPSDGGDMRTLLKNADNALHQAKGRGRNTYQFYRIEMHAMSQRELMLSTALQNPAVYKDFVLFYQPQINLENKKIISMQALLHWQHPDFGLIPLQEFARIAENNSKIISIGEWALRNAFEHLKHWQTQAFCPASIAMNVTLYQLENPHFIYKISQILQEIRLDSSSLIIEISEPILIAKLDLIEKAFHMLKHLGVQIAIKDFGSGHLSLQDLRRLPIDYLKIANSLIQDVTVNKESQAIISMIIALAKSLQITVAAEGVETQKQKQLLQELGCNIMQGTFFCPPLKAEELTAEKVVTFIHD